MSNNCVELIASAQVAVTSGSPGSIVFSSGVGFESASRGAAGSYSLTLDRHHEATRLVVQLTPNNTAACVMVATPTAATGRVNTINIANTIAGAAADSSFFVQVFHISDGDRR